MNQSNPKIALRRALDYESVGRPRDGLTTLHTFLQSRRHNRVWTQSHEDLAKKFIDLAIVLRAAPEAKDGLILYRNNTQHVAPQSLATVATYFAQQCLQRVQDVRASLDVSVVDLEDLDEEVEESPEQLMLGIVSAEGAQERAKRETLLPWVRFTWDSLKNILETLKMSKKVEHVYHATAQQCFSFLVEYERRTELHRLCETLRRHMSQLLRNASPTEPVPDASIEAHIRTRFSQLTHCCTLQQWNEAFHTLEDIHALIETTEHTPKVHVVASYYQELARVLWQSEDAHLYHAHAYYNFFCLADARNKSLTAEDRAGLATAVVLSALVIPYTAADRGSSEDYDIELEKDKKERVAALLRFKPTAGRAKNLPELRTHANPNRSSLLEEIVSAGVLDKVAPEATGLYAMLETDFHPLEIVSRVQPIAAWVAVQDALKQYAPNLERLLVHRLVEQLTQVYRTIHLSRFEALVSSLALSIHDVEKILVRAVKRHLLQVRIDHQANCLHLGEDAMENEHMRKQLTKLALGLKTVMSKISPPDTSALSDHRAAVYSAAHKSLNSMPDVVQERIQEIEARKEETERAKEREQRAKERAEAMRDAEAKRKAAEVREQMETQRRKAAERALVEEEERKLKERRAQQAEKAKLQLSKQRKQAQLAKRRSYLTRALREAEQPLLQQRVEEKVRGDEEHHNTLVREVREKLAQEHEASMAVKAHLEKMLPYRDHFEALVRDHGLADAAKRREDKVKRLREKYLRGKLKRAEVRRSKAAAAARVAAVEVPAEEDWRAHSRAPVPAPAPAAADPAEEDPAAGGGDGWETMRRKRQPAAEEGGGGGGGGWRSRQARTQEPAEEGGGRWRPSGGRGGGGGWRSREAERGGDRDGGGFGGRDGGDRDGGGFGGRGFGGRGGDRDRGGFGGRGGERDGGRDGGGAFGGRPRGRWGAAAREGGGDAPPSDSGWRSRR